MTGTRTNTNNNRHIHTLTGNSCTRKIGVYASRQALIPMHIYRENCKRAKKEKKKEMCSWCVLVSYITSIRDHIANNFGSNNMMRVIKPRRQRCIPASQQKTKVPWVTESATTSPVLFPSFSGYTFPGF